MTTIKIGDIVWFESKLHAVEAIEDTDANEFVNEIDTNKTFVVELSGDRWAFSDQIEKFGGN